MKKLSLILGILLLFAFQNALSADEPAPIKKGSGDLYVGKGDFRVGVMGSIQNGRLAGSFFRSVTSFTVETEVEYFLTDVFAPITRLSTTVVFLGSDSITDLVWGAGIKGVFNFKTRYIPYIKILPSIHFFDFEYGGSNNRSIDFDLLAGAGLDILLTKNVAVGFAFHYEVIFSDENLAVYAIPFGFSFYF